MFGFSGIMISIKSIDMHIGHGRSIGVCFANKVKLYRIGNRHFAFFSSLSLVDGRSVAIRF